MIFKVKKTGKRTYVVENKLTGRTIGREMTSQSDAQRWAHLLNREWKPLRQAAAHGEAGGQA